MKKLFVGSLMLFGLSAHADVRICKFSAYRVDVAKDQLSAELFIHGKKLDSLKCDIPPKNSWTGANGLRGSRELECEGSDYRLAVTSLSLSGQTIRRDGTLSKSLDNGTQQLLFTMSCK